MIEECACRVCELSALDDEHEKKLVHDVQEHYVHIILVNAGETPDQPAFGYTVGLWHQARHPELVMTGQKPELMHAALSAATDWVRAGHRLEPGSSIEGVIGGFPVAVEDLTKEAIAATVTFSGWFHRRTPDALQLVWTDLNGIWPWQPGAHEMTWERQPESWRIPSRRDGALAADPAWTLPVPADTFVFSCSHLEQGATVAAVVRQAHPERGEEWQVLCDRDHSRLSHDDIRLVHLSHLVRAAPSIAELGDLAVNERADRQHVWNPWTRSAQLPEPEPAAVERKGRPRWWRWAKQ